MLQSDNLDLLQVVIHVEEGVSAVVVKDQVDFPDQVRWEAQGLWWTNEPTKLGNVSLLDSLGESSICC